MSDAEFTAASISTASPASPQEKQTGSSECTVPFPILLDSVFIIGSSKVTTPTVTRPRPQPTADYIAEFLSKTQPALPHLLPLFLDSGVRTKSQLLGMADWVDDWTRHRMLDGRLTMLEGFVVNEEVMDLKELA